MFNKHNIIMFIIVVAVALFVILSGCSNKMLTSDEQKENKFNTPGSSNHELQSGNDIQSEYEIQSRYDIQNDRNRSNVDGQLDIEEKQDIHIGDVIEEAAIIEKKHELPDGFVYVDEVLQHAQYDIRYYGDYNFVGEQIEGYYSPLAILSEPAAAALSRAEQKLEPLGYTFLIYDAYRPQKAVEHFKTWASDKQDAKMKEEFYPAIDKADVFKLGYLSQRSGHSRGSTVDLTLIDIKTGEQLDMGGTYDLLDESSAHNAKGLTDEQVKNRLLLKETMIAAGFEPYRKEWWHYTLNNEPYPKKYFDFDVE